MSAPAPKGGTAARILSWLGISTCVACGQSQEGGDLLCSVCASSLESVHPREYPPPPGVDRATAAAHHAGVARELVTALKFKRRLAAADAMAERMASMVGSGDGYSALVPVPSAPWRTRFRGFNPSAEIARALGNQIGVGTVDCLRRQGESRQLGRGRSARRAPDFRLEVKGMAPPSCLLVDDVYTTGGTLTACAVALREAGAEQVSAITFTRRL